MLFDWLCIKSYFEYQKNTNGYYNVGTVLDGGISHIGFGVWSILHPSCPCQPGLELGGGEEVLYLDLGELHNFQILHLASCEHCHLLVLM